MTQSFSGLGLHLGNLSRLSTAKSRSISAGESDRREGQGRDGRGRAPARSTPAASGAAGRFRLRSASRPARRSCSATSRAPARSSRSGSRRRTCAGAISSCASIWDEQDASLGRGAARRFLRLRLGPLRAGELARRLRQSGARLQLLLGDAVPPQGAAHPGEPRSGRGGHHLLADQLRADRGSRGRRLFPRAVPPHQPAAVQAGLCLARRRQRAWALRRDLCRLGRQQFRLVGRGRDQVLSRRRRMADDLRHGHRGLFLRRLQFRRRARSIPPSRAPTSNSRRPTPGCRRSSGRTGPTSRSSASASTAGTSWTRSASRRTSR